ncbi:MAG: ATPase domain-containing protein [Candidatus Saliniplasma sp.]
MSNKGTKRVKTYVRGLDKNLKGGVPERSVVLLAGPPGTMKSSMAFSILYNNALKEDKRSVYISLEETRDSLIENMKGLGMDWNDVDRKMSILDLGLIRSRVSELESLDWIQVFKRYVKNLKKNIDNQLLVIDSLPVLKTMANFEDSRRDLFKFFEWLRGMKLTAFLVHEMSIKEIDFSKAGEGFLSDGTIHLELQRKETNMNLFLSVLKMRKTDHPRDYFPLIYDDGFEIVKS